MALFQSTVIQKYINAQDQSLLKEKWEAYKTHFQDTSIQENIRNAKEEQYQEGFLRDLFVKILGYTLNPATDYNLTTELKNIKDSKKADGGIIVKDKVVGVIELKGTNTTDLSKIEVQAFGYKNNQPSCTYVITSNFEKIRFYIDNAIEHETFNLFELTEDDFGLLYLCLAYENIKLDIPKKIKSDSHNQEDITTKQLYKDYSVFKRELYNNLVELNPKHEPLLLFKKSQKLLDRFLFLFFAEDRHLLPPNSVRLILKQWKQLKELDAYTPLYKRFKKYFGYLNTGYKGEKYDVYPYNGGLFRPDEILDKITVNDDLLYEHTLKLAEYDFASEVDVNILGHIFENSLNEIEEIQTQLEENPSEVKISKRKKDGVFYTPKYITKYIVENTIGKLCEEKKEELSLVEEDYNIKRQTKTKKQLLKRLNTYRDWLLQLTVVDPACGSGAFLSEALNYLIAEHEYLDELETKLMGGGLVFPNVENSILENNLFGVDINNESVEIAKLSLWLRTAQPNRKLNDLSNNIKCGNSLIDDPEVAGQKAFNWEKEFPQVFAKGGFDVVIGNPPYGAKLDYKEWLKVKFKKTSFGNIDSYKYFVQIGTELLKANGTLGYIMPDSYLEKEYFKDLREYISSNFKDIRNIKLGDDVFEEVNLPTAIALLKFKGKKTEVYEYKDISSLKSDNKSILLQNEDNFIEETPDFKKSFVIFKSIISDKIDTVPLIDVYDQVMGVKVYQKGKGKPKQTNSEKDNNVFVSKVHDEKFNYHFISQGIGRYQYESQGEFISYGEWLAEPRKSFYFEKSKVIIREIINPRIFASYIEYPAVVKNIAAVIVEKDSKYSLLFLLAIINSKLFTYYVNEQSPKSNNKSYPSFNSRLLKALPVKVATSNQQQPFIEKAKQMLFSNKELEEFSAKFQRNLQRQFPEELEKLPKKLQDWYELSYANFIKELKKKKIKLSLSQEGEWEEYFLSEQQKAKALKSQIDQTDKEIDQMVYELYGLTDEEIGIVENA